MLHCKKLVFLLVTILALPAAVHAADAAYPKLNLKMSTTVGEQSTAAVMAKEFAKVVGEASKGNIRIRVYPSDPLSGG
ncbi:MAG: C4-dicarboxylate ABC transporter, partial [Deltaproteobacteria bacterium]|nr:C4-dicarboxylate ABC transporter [Deltaproteobacteria bacterium]